MGLAPDEVLRPRLDSQPGQACLGRAGRGLRGGSRAVGASAGPVSSFIWTLPLAGLLNKCVSWWEIQGHPLLFTDVPVLGSTGPQHLL